MGDYSKMDVAMLAFQTFTSIEGVLDGRRGGRFPEEIKNSLDIFVKTFNFNQFYNDIFNYDQNQLDRVERLCLDWLKLLTIEPIKDFSTVNYFNSSDTNKDGNISLAEIDAKNREYMKYGSIPDYFRPRKGTYEGPSNRWKATVFEASGTASGGGPMVGGSFANWVIFENLDRPEINRVKAFYTAGIVEGSGYMEVALSAVVGKAEANLPTYFNDNLKQVAISWEGKFINDAVSIAGGVPGASAGVVINKFHSPYDSEQYWEGTTGGLTGSVGGGSCKGVSGSTSTSKYLLKDGSFQIIQYDYDKIEENYYSSSDTDNDGFIDYDEREAKLKEYMIHGNNPNYFDPLTESNED